MYIFVDSYNEILQVLKWTHLNCNKKIGAFLIISVMLVSMMFTSINTDMLAVDEIPEPKAIILLV